MTGGPSINWDALYEKGLACLAAKGWHHFTLLSMAKETHEDVYFLTTHFPNQQTFLTKAAQWALAKHPQTEHPDRDLSHDAVFDQVMNRLDALEPLRPALVKVRETAMADPCLAMDLAFPWIQDVLAHWAPLTRGNLLGRLALTRLYAKVFWVWMDDTPDGSRTMRTLDETLTQTLEFFFKDKDRES